MDIIGIAERVAQHVENVAKGIQTEVECHYEENIPVNTAIIHMIMRVLVHLRENDWTKFRSYVTDILFKLTRFLEAKGLIGNFKCTSRKKKEPP